MTICSKATRKKIEMTRQEWIAKFAEGIICADDNIAEAIRYEQHIDIRPAENHFYEGGDNLRIYFADGLIVDIDITDKRPEAIMEEVINVVYA